MTAGFCARCHGYRAQVLRAKGDVVGACRRAERNPGPAALAAITKAREALTETQDAAAVHAAEHEVGAA